MTVYLVVLIVTTALVSVGIAIRRGFHLHTFAGTDFVFGLMVMDVVFISDGDRLPAMVNHPWVKRHPHDWLAVSVALSFLLFVVLLLLEKAYARDVTQMDERKEHRRRQLVLMVSRILVLMDVIGHCFPATNVSAF